MLFSLPGPLYRLALSLFRRLPVPVRRSLVHLGSPTWSAGAVMVLRDEAGRLLLVRSRHARGWSLPGGLLRRGEQPLAGALREVAEEVGLRLSAEDVTVAAAVAHLDVEARQVTALFRARLSAEQCAAVHPDGVEVVKVAFFAPDELPARRTRDLDEHLAAVGW